MSAAGGVIAALVVGGMIVGGVHEHRVEHRAQVREAAVLHAKAAECTVADLTYREAVRTAGTARPWVNADAAFDRVADRLEQAPWYECEKSALSEAAEDTSALRLCRAQDTARRVAFRHADTKRQWHRADAINRFEVPTWMGGIHCVDSSRTERADDRAYLRAFGPTPEESVERSKRSDGHVTVRACWGHVIRVCVG